MITLLANFAHFRGYTSALLETTWGGPKTRVERLRSADVVLSIVMQANDMFDVDVVGPPTRKLRSQTISTYGQ